jgi:hypothetical protein
MATENNGLVTVIFMANNELYKLSKKHIEKFLTKIIVGNLYYFSQFCFYFTLFFIGVVLHD